MAPNGIAVAQDTERVLEIRRISAPRFKEGGAAMLHAEKQNHQKVIVGKNVISPFVTYILRDWAVS